MSKVRNVVFTWNNYPEDWQSQLRELAHVGYLICQEETGEAGTPHLQGYIEFTSQWRFPSLAKKFKWHIEKRKGSQSQAIEYCKKDDTRTGEQFTFGELKVQGKRNDIESAVESLRAGASKRKMVDDHGTVVCKYHRGLDYIRGILDKDNTKAFRHLTVSVFWGKAGCGKTRKACDIGGDDCYILNSPGANGMLWWDGYDGESTLIIDDFYGWVKHFDLLRILDGHQYRMQVKGGFTWAKWTKVVITSNKPPVEWYPSMGLTPALARRLNEINEL